MSSDLILPAHPARKPRPLPFRVLRSLSRSPVRAARSYTRTLCSWLGLFADIRSIRDYRYLHGLQRSSSVRDRFSGDLIPLRIRPLDGKPMYCRPGTTDVTVLEDVFLGLYHLPPRDLPIRTILDLGSNIGLTIAHYAHLYPGARVLGIELDQGNFKVCEKNLVSYSDRCSVVWGAAWSHDGEVAYEGEAEWGYRVLDGSSSARRAPAFSIKSLIDRLGAEIVDFVKMDVEGAEELLLASPESWIHRVRCVKVEVHEPYSVEACIEDLERAGLRCEVFTKHRACVIARRS